MTDQLPPESVAAAAEIIARVADLSLDWEEACALARQVLEVAAPAIRAAERERIRQMAERNEAVCTSDEGTSCYFADLLVAGPGEQP